MWQALEGGEVGPIGQPVLGQVDGPQPGKERRSHLPEGRGGGGRSSSFISGSPPTATVETRRLRTMGIAYATGAMQLRHSLPQP